MPLSKIKWHSSFCTVKRLREGKKESMKDGVLIYDEVKVVSRLMWNSHNHKLIGLSMNSGDQSSLADIYQFAGWRSC